MRNNGLSTRGQALLALLMMLTAFCSGARADITTGLWGHWPLDGTLNDLSGNTHTLASPGVGGSPIISTEGKYSACYQFDNSVSAQMLWPGALSTPIAAQSPVTITAWVNPSVLGTGYTATSPHTIAW